MNPYFRTKLVSELNSFSAVVRSIQKTDHDGLHKFYETYGQRITEIREILAKDKMSTGKLKLVK